MIGHYEYKQTVISVYIHSALSLLLGAPPSNLILNQMMVYDKDEQGNYTPSEASVCMLWELIGGLLRNYYTIPEQEEYEMSK